MPRLSKSRVLHRLGLPDSAAALCPCPDGKRVAVASLAGEVFVLDAATGGLSSTGAVHRGGALAVAWHPNGDVLATAGQDGRVGLVRTGAPPTYRSFGRGWVEHVAWSSDGTRLAIAVGKAVHVVGLDGEPLARYENRSTVAALAWLPGSSKLVVAGYGGLCVYDSVGGGPAVSLESPGALLSLAPSPDGTVIAAGRQDDVLELWSWPLAKPADVSGFSGKVRQLAWNKSGSLLAAAGGDVITLWSFAGGAPVGKEPRVLEGHRDVISGLAFFKDDGLIAVDEAGNFIVWIEQDGAWTAACGFRGKAPLIGLCATRDLAVVAAQDASLSVVSLGDGP